MHNIGLIFLFAIASIGMAYAQTNSTDAPEVTFEEEQMERVIVMTDKDSYADGEKILITGKVKDRLSDVPVTIRILAPNGNLVSVDQVMVGEDKTFSTDITAGGSLMSQSGLYRVVVLYGFTVGKDLPEKPTAADLERDKKYDKINEFTSNEAEAVFTYGAAPPAPEPVASTGEGYEITGGTITDISSDMENKKMIISLQTTSDGVLTITLLRSLIDSVSPDGRGDIPFTVLIDGLPVMFEETNTLSDSRTLKIPFKQGATKIEIVGTFIIPEFGSIALVILAVAIVSTIIVTSRRPALICKC